MTKLKILNEKKSKFLQTILKRSCFYPFIFLTLLLIIFFIYSLFFPIPTEGFSGHVGIGSDILNIGDRDFYLNSFLKDSNQSNVKPSFLYPFILQLIKVFVSIFGYDEQSKLMNLLVISLSSILSLFSLFLIDDIAWDLFGKRVAILSSWLYVICPYTIFFAISGSLTHYILLGTNLSFWIILKSKILNKTNFNNNIKDLFKNIFLLSLCSMYLACLRPTGAIFAITLLTLSLLFITLKIKLSFKKFYFLYPVPIIVIFFSFYQLHLTSAYLKFAYDIFINEPGYFFGVEREILRERLLIAPDFSIEYFKSFILQIMWKISDFFSGLSDVRDTFTDFNNVTQKPPLFPFIARVFTGLIYFVPVNISSLLGFIKYRRKILNSGLWILLISIFATISPSILGVASNRYMYMLYTPFLIFSASIFSDVLKQEDNYKNIPERL